MANPNIVTATSIEAKVETFLLKTQGSQSRFDNPVDSGKVFKINTIVACNVSDFDRTLRIFLARPSGGFIANITQDFPLPKQTTFTVISSDTPIYLMENMRVQSRANVSNTVRLTISYEEIS